MALEVREHVPLAPYTTLKVGGTARYFAEVSSVAELKEAGRFASRTGRPVLLLGGGSNLLVADGTLERFVIKVEIKGINYLSLAAGASLITAGAGEEWDTLVLDTVEKGLSGLENLSGVPGTVGAAPVQNINCYGATVSDVIESVMVYDLDTEQERKLTASECLFGYRDSIFKHPAGSRLVVTSVTFHLLPAGSANLTYRSASQSIERYLLQKGIDNPTPAEVREAILVARSNIGMLRGQYRSAGSFFKNVVVSAKQFANILKKVESDYPELNAKLAPWHWPLPGGEEKISTAFLLECSPYNKRTYGEKRVNGVGISPKHSLSIVTEDGATAADVKKFVSLIKGSVKEIFHVELESEVVIVA